MPTVYPSRFVIRDRERFGLIDKSGMIVVEPTFAYLGEYAEGLTCFRQQDLFGFIDCDGTVIIEPKFRSLRLAGPRFSNGFALVGDKPGDLHYIDRNGHQVFPCSFYFATDFKDSFAITKPSVASTGYTVIDKTSRPIGQVQAFDIPDRPGWPRSWDLFNCFVMVQQRLLV